MMYAAYVLMTMDCPVWLLQKVARVTVRTVPAGAYFGATNTGPAVASVTWSSGSSRTLPGWHATVIAGVIDGPTAMPFTVMLFLGLARSASRYGSAQPPWLVTGFGGRGVGPITGVPARAGREATGDGASTLAPGKPCEADAGSSVAS